MEKEGSQIGVHLVMNIGSQMVVHMAIIVPDIIQEDSQDGVQFVARPVTIPINVRVQSSRRPRMQSGMRLLGKKMSNGKISRGRLRTTKLPMGSQHPSPNVKTFCKFEPQIWLEIITSRDAQSACFKGLRTSCREIIFGIFLAKFWPEKITSRDGCFLPIQG